MKNLLTVFKHEGQWKMKDSVDNKIKTTGFHVSQMTPHEIHNLIKKTNPESNILIIWGNFQPEAI